MAYEQHTFRLDADLSERFVRIAARLRLTRAAAFRQAIADWNRDAAKLADKLEKDEAGPESEG